jgi:hypothetical protein
MFKIDRATAICPIPDSFISSPNAGLGACAFSVFVMHLVKVIDCIKPPIDNLICAQKTTGFAMLLLNVSSFR